MNDAFTGRPWRVRSLAWSGFLAPSCTQSFQHACLLCRHVHARSCTRARALRREAQGVAPQVYVRAAARASIADDCLVKP
eukprot:6208870-Pleurochrysis_carterae.AAC.4